MEREREGGEAGSISERGELELKLSPAVDTVSGEILFFSERRQMFGYQVRNRSLFSLFFFFDRGWKMVEPEFFEKSRNFLILLPRFFFGGRRFLYFCIVEIVSISFLFFFFFEGIEEDSCCISMLF